MKTGNLIPFFIADNYKKNNFKGTLNAFSMFVDISGFTLLTQKLMIKGKEGIEILSDILQNFDEIIEKIYKYKGFVCGFAGDSFLALFPVSESRVLEVIKCAEDIRKKIISQSKIKTEAGEIDFAVKIGISYGTADWGIIKSKTSTYYFKGNAVNQCTKAEKQSFKNEICIDENIFSLVERFQVEKNVKITKKRIGFFAAEYVLPLKTPDKMHLKKIDTSIIKDFLPNEIINLTSKGEFRENVSLFISIKENEKTDELVKLIMDLTVKYKGFYNKLDYGDKGCNTLINFGAPVSYENDIERALDLILELKKNRKFTDSFRVGITYGISYAGFLFGSIRTEYSSIGKSTNLAARFMMRAKWGEILTDKNIYKNMQFKYDFNYMGEFDFKGFNYDIPVYKLRKKLFYSSRIEFKGDFVGRINEVKKISEKIENLEFGNFQGIVYVDGLAGIGKSRLIDHVRKNIEKIDLNWCYLPCNEITRTSFNSIIHYLKGFFAYSEDNSVYKNENNFNDIFTSFLDKIPSEELNTELLRRKVFIGSVLNLFENSNIIKDLTAEKRYENILSGLKTFFKSLSLIKPVVLELEDGQWSDFETLEFLSVLTRNIQNFPILIIVTCRYNSDGSLFKIKGDKIPEIRISLNEFDINGTEVYIKSKLKTVQKIPEETVNFVYRKSEGNPFYIEQILLYLKENNYLDDNNNITAETFEIPSTINSLIIARVDKLNIKLKKMIKIASVLGREFKVNILKEMLKEVNIKKELSIGEKENIWEFISEIIYIFKHALIRESIYNMQLKNELIQLHRLAAETIEKIYRGEQSFYAEIANHYQKSEIKDKAAEYLWKIGEISKDNYENFASIEYFEKLEEIIECLETPHKTDFEMLIKTKINLGELAKRIGKTEEAKKYFFEAKELAEKNQFKSLEAKAHSFLGIIFRVLSDYSKAYEHHVKAREINEFLGDIKYTAESLGDIGMLFYYKTEYDTAEEYFALKKELSEKIGYEKGISDVYSYIGLIHIERGDYEKGLEYLKRHLESAEKIGDISVTARSLLNIGLAYQQMDEYQTAKEYYEKALDASLITGSIESIGTVSGNLGIISYYLGDMKKAKEYFKKDLDISKELGKKTGVARAYVNLGVISYLEGNFDEAMEYYKRDYEISAELGHKADIAIAVNNMGLIYDDLGEFEKALQCYKEDYNICEELKDKKGVASSLNNQGNTYRNLGDYERSLECFNSAIRILETLKAKYLLADCYIDKGEIILLQGNPESASFYFEKGVALAEEIGGTDKLFEGNLLFNKCSYLLTQDEIYIEELLKALEDYEEDEQKGSIYYTLWEITQKKEYAVNAHSIYEKLHEKTPKFNYLRKIIELRIFFKDND